MADKPKRIERKRTKGWRMPPNTLYVGRPSKWGNPFIVGDPHPHPDKWGLPIADVAEAVELFQTHTEIFGMLEDLGVDARSELRGKNLCCWCALDQACHADILLELAND